MELSRSDLRLRRLNEYFWIVREIWKFWPKVYPSAFFSEHKLAYGLLIKGRNSKRPNTKRCVARQKNRVPSVEQVDRNRKIYLSRLDGNTFRKIAEEYGLSLGRVQQICAAQAEKEERRRRYYTRAHLARPIDPGGPRDVWLYFFPGDDVRTETLD